MPRRAEGGGGGRGKDGHGVSLGEAVQDLAVCFGGTGTGLLCRGKCGRDMGGSWVGVGELLDLQCQSQFVCSGGLLHREGLATGHCTASTGTGGGAGGGGAGPGGNPSGEAAQGEVCSAGHGAGLAAAEAVRHPEG